MFLPFQSGYRVIVGSALRIAPVCLATLVVGLTACGCGGGGGTTAASGSRADVPSTTPTPSPTPFTVLGPPDSTNVAPTLTELPSLHPLEGTIPPVTSKVVINSATFAADRINVGFRSYVTREDIDIFLRDEGLTLFLYNRDTKVALFGIPDGADVRQVNAKLALHPWVSDVNLVEIVTGF